MHNLTPKEAARIGEIQLTDSNGEKTTVWGMVDNSDVVFACISIAGVPTPTGALQIIKVPNDWPAQMKGRQPVGNAVSIIPCPDEATIQALRKYCNR